MPTRPAIALSPFQCLCSDYYRELRLEERLTTIVNLPYDHIAEGI
jgi:hypothetical protein